MRMKIFCKWAWQCGLPAILLLAGAATSAGQQLPNGPPGQLNSRSQANPNIDPTLQAIHAGAAANEASLGIYANNQLTEAEFLKRQAYMAQEVQMVKDSKKLLELATKLNAEVASQHGAALTPGELREVAQIEKLAHSVRTKMEAPVPSSLLQPGQPPKNGHLTP